MDYLSVAASLVTTAIVPLFKTLGTKAMEEVGKRTGQEVFDNRQTILGAVKDLLVGEELTTLGLLEKYPDNEDIQSEVVKTIETKLKANPDTAESLNHLTNTVAEIENINVKTSKLIAKIRLARNQNVQARIMSENIRDSQLESEIEID
jgi:hypothetical protein